MTSYLSDTRIRSETQKWADKVSQLTSKIDDRNAILSALDGEINAINAGLSDADYVACKNDYNSYKKQISTLNKQLKSSKSKATKNKLTSQINDLKSKKTNCANKMRQIAKNKGFSKQLTAMLQKSHNKDMVNKLISDLKKQRTTATKQRNYWKNITESRRRALIAKRNAPVIAEQMKRGKSKGHTMIYRTDMQDSRVFELIETSPTETGTNDVATKPIDGGQVETNFIAQSSIEYSATFYLRGKDFNDCDNKYKQLLDWSYQYELTVDGFSRWKHAYITSIAKSTDNTINSNGMIISITFSYARQAQIKYKKVTKGKTKHKAGAKKSSGSRKGKKGRYITVKPGMTYSQISKKTGTSLSSLIKMNKWKSSNLPVGAKVRYA